MTRDELLLAALIGGESSSGALAEATGLAERSCRHGLQHLIGADYVWSPKRGVYRLTARGRTIAAEVGMPSPETGPGTGVDTPDEARYKALPWLGRRRP
jgi:hypothetical protein